LISLRGQWILENEDDGVTAEEHFADVAILVDGLCLLLTWKQRKGVNSTGLYKI